MVSGSGCLGRQIHLFHSRFHTLNSILVEGSFRFLRRITWTIITLLMPAITASLLGILEQLFALLAIPSYMSSYILHFPFCQGESLLAVAGIAVGMFIGFGSGSD